MVRVVIFLPYWSFLLNGREHTSGKRPGTAQKFPSGLLKVSTAAGVGDGDTMRGGVGTPTAVGLGLGVGDKAGEGETVGVAVGGGVGPLFELVVSLGYKSTPATPTTSNKAKRTPIRATT